MLLLIILLIMSDLDYYPSSDEKNDYFKKVTDTIANMDNYDV
jgi:hypothetical protein